MPSRWRVLSAEFVKSCYHPKDFPGESLLEAAFAGRSNVGKSSLINALVNQKRLATTSSTPGRTQSVNFFRVRISPEPRPEGFPGIMCHFVDLPGYGYAKVPVEVQRAWRPLVESYLKNNDRLRGMFLLIDARREPGDEERQLAEYLASLGVDYQIVLTKCDKSGRGAIASLKAALVREFQLPDNRPPIAFSVTQRVGIEEVMLRIGEWIAP